MDDKEILAHIDELIQTEHEPRASSPRVRYPARTSTSG